MAACTTRRPRPQAPPGCRATTPAAATTTRTHRWPSPPPGASRHAGGSAARRRTQPQHCPITTARRATPTRATSSPHMGGSRPLHGLSPPMPPLGDTGHHHCVGVSHARHAQPQHHHPRPPPPDPLTGADRATTPGWPVSSTSSTPSHCRVLGPPTILCHPHATHTPLGEEQEDVTRSTKQFLNLL